MSRNVLLLGGMSEAAGWIRWGWVNEVWTFNDSFGTFDWRDVYKPSRIFQLHDPDESKWGRKWRDGWRRKYIDSGADIYVREIDPKLPKDRQKIFPYHLAAQQFPPEWFTSTMAYMLWLAAWERVESVTILGVVMQAPEYRGAVPGLVRALDHCKSCGVIIRSQRESIWRMDMANIDSADEQRAMGYAWPKQFFFRPNK